MDLERTLIVFKPDAVQRGIVGEVLSRFERVGLKFVGLKMLAPGQEHYYKHYEEIGTMITRHGKEIFDVTVFNMMEGPVVAAVLEGINSVELVRKLVGPTEPGKAAPGTIRGDYAQSNFSFANSRGRTLPNVLHASATPDEARQEVDLWFDESELVMHQTVHEKIVHGKEPK